MAQITVTIPDALVPRVVAALKWAYPVVAAQTTGDGELGRACIRQWLRDTVARSESRQVTTNASEQAQTALNTAYNDMGAIT